MSIGWDRQVSGYFDAALRIEVENRPGVLAQVAAAIAHAESNIDRVEYLERDARVAAIRFAIEVSDRKHLAEVIRRVRDLYAQGSSLNAKTMERQYITLITAARRRFPSWDRTLQAAGLDYRNIVLRAPFKRRRRPSDNAIPTESVSAVA